ncbi:MAG: MMPL family transporter, partial [Clostridiales bacterium]|nr:MMPL family transporter [Clostridiales bacterium]
MSFSKAVVKNRVLILIITFLLLIPSVFGYINTRVNYDMLDYLPQNMETVIGQEELLKEFGKGAFSFVIVENMTPLEVSGLKEKIEKVDHVESVIWYDSIFDLTVPMEMLPKKVYDAFNTDHSTIMAVFFDTSTSADETMQAIASIRKIADKECFVSGMSALVTDLKELCEREEPIYVAIAVALALVAMMLLLDSFLAPIVFLLSIGMMILLNLGSNIFFGEISYITKALSAVLQLAVTMDYSIFLWHSYNEQRERFSDNKEAMMVAIRKTLSSVIGSSVTTVAGFIALCFMSFTMGRDLGLVMAKGVIIGVIGCVTVLPSLILVLDKPLQKSRHRSLIPSGGKISKGIVKIFPVFLLIFAILVVPSYYIYRKAGNEVYYDISQSIPQDMPNVIANNKLKTEFHMATQEMVLTDSTLDPNETRKMINEMEQVDGVNYVLSLESLIGADVPQEILPKDILGILKGEKWELMLINSQYGLATDELNDQIDQLNSILKKHDPKGLLIGEGPCTKDLIETTDKDFRIVTIVSVVLVFLIIALVTKSISLPFILISVIELAIFINLGIPHLTGSSMPFVGPIFISTIQLGATVDYAILMTT